MAVGGELSDEFFENQRNAHSLTRIINELASKAWEAVHKKGVEVYEAVAQFFSDVAKFFNDLGTKVSKSISNFFEDLNKTASHRAAVATLGGISKRGKEAMEDESVVKYNVKKKSEENKSYDETRQKKLELLLLLKKK